MQRGGGGDGTEQNRGTMGIVFPAYPSQTPHRIHLCIAARRSDLMCDRWCKEKAPRCVACRRFGEKRWSRFYVY